MGFFSKTFKKLNPLSSSGGFLGGAIGGLGGPIGGLAGTYAGNKASGVGASRGPRAASNPNFPATPMEMGTSISQAPGAWNTLYQQLAGGEGPSGQSIAEIMEAFPGGSGRHMQKWFKEAAPMMSMQLFNSDPYKFMQDQGNWDKSMQAYGTGAGMLGQSAQRGLGQGQNQLARMGLGRSGAQAALANQSQQALGGQQANMFTNLFQQSVQNRLQGAQQAFDLDRSIMQMAMGSTQMPPARQNSPGLGGAIGSAAGSALGMGLGALATGGFGGAAGAAGGGAGAGAGAGSFFPGMGPGSFA